MGYELSKNIQRVCTVCTRPRDKTVLRVLADYGHDTGKHLVWQGRVRPAVATIARQTGYCETTVDKALKSLQKLGLITKVRNSTHNEGAAYDINLSAVFPPETTTAPATTTAAKSEPTIPCPFKSGNRNELIWGRCGHQHGMYTTQRHDKFVTTYGSKKLTKAGWISEYITWVETTRPAERDKRTNGDALAERTKDTALVSLDKVANELPELSECMGWRNAAALAAVLAQFRAEYRDKKLPVHSWLDTWCVFLGLENLPIPDRYTKSDYLDDFEE